jgi:hypothetical protein
MHAPALIQEAIAAVKPYQPVHTGEYKRSWKVRNIPDGAAFFNPTLQASIIERGRRPGHGVSREGQEALARWAHLHGMDRFDGNRGMRRPVRGKAGKESQARAIAFLIARKIKARGLPAKNVLGSVKAQICERVRADVQDMMAKGNLSAG